MNKTQQIWKKNQKKVFSVCLCSVYFEMLVVLENNTVIVKMLCVADPFHNSKMFFFPIAALF